MERQVFRRKIYDEICDWKVNRSDKYALLIKGERRVGKSTIGNKICPIEVKSGNYRSHKSLDVFCNKFSSRIKDKYVVHTKDYKRKNGINYIPIYMVPFI